MEYLYNLKMDSWHVKFFKWLWGVDPTDKYKTMCPYFWSFVGSIIILPALLTFKLIKPIILWYKRYSDAQIDAQIRSIIEKLKSDSLMDYDAYKFYNNECIGFNALVSTEGYEDNMWYKIVEGHSNYIRKLKLDKKQRQETLDKFKYGFFGKVVTYTITAIILGLICWGIYAILHLFTWQEFVEFMIKMFAIIGAGGILVGGGFVVYWIIMKTKCNVYLNEIVFWKYIGEFFVMIWTGIKIIFNMIGHLYKQTCPIIHWK